VLADITPVLPSFLGGKKTDDRARKLAAIPLGRYGLPDDLGQAAVFLCSDAASLITGMVMNIDGGAGL
jgi:3-oxoacyl-[acyl-carrier protein] reductase